MPCTSTDRYTPQADSTAELDCTALQVAGQQAARTQETNERAAVQRLERVRDDQARRMDALHAQAEAAELQVCTLYVPLLHLMPPLVPEPRVSTPAADVEILLFMQDPALTRACQLLRWLATL